MIGSLADNDPMRVPSPTQLNLPSSVAPSIASVADDDPIHMVTGNEGVFSHVSTNLPSLVAPLIGLLADGDPSLFATLQYIPAAPSLPKMDSLHGTQHCTKNKVFNAHCHWTHLDVRRYMGLFDCPPDNPSPLCMTEGYPCVHSRTISYKLYDVMVRVNVDNTGMSLLTNLRGSRKSVLNGISVSIFLLLLFCDYTIYIFFCSDFFAR